MLSSLFETTKYVRYYTVTNSKESVHLSTLKIEEFVGVILLPRIYHQDNDANTSNAYYCVIRSDWNRYYV